MSQMNKQSLLKQDATPSLLICISDPHTGHLLSIVGLLFFYIALCIYNCFQAIFARYIGSKSRILLKIPGTARNAQHIFREGRD
jgi:hypothetical protein